MRYADQFRWHETAQDRTNERKAMQVMCNYTRCSAKKEEGRQDFRMYRAGKYVALAEVKTRTIPFHKWEDFKLDRDKIDELKARATKDGVAAVLVVSWAVDGAPSERDIRYLDVKRTDFSTMRVEPLKRGDRDELADLAYRIPTNLFKIVPDDSCYLPVES